MAVNTISPTKILHQCKICDQGFYPKRTNHTDCCSRDCGFKYAAFLRVARKTRLRVSFTIKRTQACEVCFKWMPFGTRTDKKVCSDKCLKQKARVRSYERSKALFTSKDFTCEECGTKVTRNYGNKNSKYCSKPCSRKAHNRTKRKKERSLGYRGLSKTVNPNVVFDRDGWICQMCNTDTPRLKRSTYDNDAPELDHIIPLSKGGDHSYENTQCLCRQCNASKSDKIMECS
jgi:hypothetical protein